MTARYLRATAFFALVIAGALVVTMTRAQDSDTHDPRGTQVTPISNTDTTAKTVPLMLLGTDGAFVGPFDAPRLELTGDEWRERLTDEQFRILRNEGTEAAFCGNLLDNKKSGVYRCAGCGLPLFSSDAKFTSGTGWPSFFQPVATENINFIEDNSLGMKRIEIECARCDGHLGHVFPDGPEPTGLRFCLNSESLVFTDKDDLASAGEVGTAVFAGGCFWCTEAVFEQLEGVYSVESGYTGGNGPADYKEVCTGDTGHAEAIRIYYDADVIDYAKLLEIHFATHDPTQVNRQGNDVGTQYRSSVFYATPEQLEAADAYIKKLDASGRYSSPIATRLEPLKEFYVAEEYHQDFARTNPDHPYIRSISAPKVKKLRKNFPDLLKGTTKQTPGDG